MRFFYVAIVVVGAPLLMAPDCGDSFGDKREGATCTRSEDCVRDLTCVRGECTSLHDAGGVDASSTDSSVSDGAQDATSDAPTHD